MNEEGINVLSLFDEMSCGYISLDKANIKETKCVTYDNGKSQTIYIFK